MFAGRPRDLEDVRAITEDRAELLPALERLLAEARTDEYLPGVAVVVNG